VLAVDPCGVLAVLDANDAAEDRTIHILPDAYQASYNGFHKSGGDGENRGRPLQGA